MMGRRSGVALATALRLGLTAATAAAEGFNVRDWSLAPAAGREVAAAPSASSPLEGAAVGTWTAQDSRRGADLNDVAFTDASHGWAVSGGRLIEWSVRP